MIGERSDDRLEEKIRQTLNADPAAGSWKIGGGEVKCTNNWNDVVVAVVGGWSLTIPQDSEDQFLRPIRPKGYAELFVCCEVMSTTLYACEFRARVKRRRTHCQALETLHQPHPLPGRE